jgi:hypothetical protein
MLPTGLLRINRDHQPDPEALVIGSDQMATVGGYALAAPFELANNTCSATLASTPSAPTPAPPKTTAPKPSTCSPQTADQQKRRSVS